MEFKWQDFQCSSDFNLTKFIRAKTKLFYYTPMLFSFM